MKIALTLPPNIAEIEKVFGAACRKPGVLFCYGDTIHNPTGVSIPKELVAHEEIHSRRQLAEYFTGLPGERDPSEPNWSPEKWWHWYLTNPQFRYNEELLAHRQEHMTFGLTHNRIERRLHLKAIADRLSGPLYGFMVTKAAASKAILEK